MKVRKESKQDLAKALQPKYLKASRAQKGNLLDEFVEVTGYHRNRAKKLLLNGPPTPVVATELIRAYDGHLPSQKTFKNLH